MPDINKREPMQRDDLIALLMQDPQPIIEGLVDGLGSISEPEQWDSEAIEILLGRIERPLRELGIPSIGNTEANDEDWAFWCMVTTGELPPDPDDPYGGDEDDAQVDWAYEVSNGDTKLGLREWWDHKIESARDDAGRTS